MVRWHENAGLRFGQNGIRSLAAIKLRSIAASEIRSVAATKTVAMRAVPSCGEEVVKMKCALALRPKCYHGNCGLWLR
jgi:hypothetical protein